MDPDLEPQLRTRALVVAAAVCGGYIAMLATALVPWPWAVVALAAVAALAEEEAERSLFVRPVLRRAQMGPAARSLLRDLAVLVLVGTAAHDVRARAAALSSVVVVRFLVLLVYVVVRRRAVQAVLGRNIELPALPVPGPLGRLVLGDELQVGLHHVTAVAAVGTALAVAVDTTVVAWVACGVALAALAVCVGVLGRALVTSRGRSRADQVRAAQAAVDRLGARVMLYFSGTPDSTYQVNTWLRTLERLPEPALVVVREPAHLQTMQQTTLPVLAVPAMADFMALTWSRLRVVMYVANVGKNLHMLRERGLRHVFIGHGDSDKTGSFNPFSKVYSEIWVAGPAGRERYHRAGIGVHDEEIVEVGRPQLTGISAAAPAPGPRLTVLYAPTWEGWPGDPPHSSLAGAGVRIVRDLLAAGDVRVLYKPHPLTGAVAKQAAAAGQKIQALLRGAGGDHEVVPPSRSLYDCFNAADVLVGDISSVVTDFLASEKPYLMANLHALPEEELRERFPSAAGAYLLGANGSGVDAALATIRGGDPMAGARRAARLHLLGATAPGDMSAFVAAIDSAASTAERLWPVRPAAEAV
jgi:hypothetical protein